MFRRLSKQEKDRLRKELLGKQVLFRALLGFFSKEAPELSILESLRFPPEEVFWRAMTAVDEVKAHKDEAAGILRYLPASIDADYCEFGTFPYHNLTCYNAMTVAAVVNILAFAENSEDAEDEHTRWVGSYYKSKEDNYSLRYALNQIDNCRAEIISYGEEKFQSAAREYMNSPRRLSEEIEALLDGTPATLPGGEAPKEEAYEEAAVGKKHPQLTHRQVLIFVNQYLNLDLKECNQTKLAELLALIMGGNPGSIRTSIKRLAALDEDTDEYKDDVRLLAELLDPLKPSLATRLRNHAEP